MVRMVSSGEGTFPRIRVHLPTHHASQRRGLRGETMTPACGVSGRKKDAAEESRRGAAEAPFHARRSPSIHEENRKGTNSISYLPRAHKAWYGRGMTRG